MTFKKPLLSCALTMLILAGCSLDRGDVGRKSQCLNGLDAGYRELNQAKADGLGGAVKWSKAATLLAAAKVQEQFEEYQNCAIKSENARRHLRELRS